MFASLQEYARSSGTSDVLHSSGQNYIVVCGQNGTVPIANMDNVSAGADISLNGKTVSIVGTGNANHYNHLIINGIIYGAI